MHNSPYAKFNPFAVSAVEKLSLIVVRLGIEFNPFCLINMKSLAVFSIVPVEIIKFIFSISTRC